MNVSVRASTTANLWTNTAFVGGWTNGTSANLSYPVIGLAANTTYYFTFQATNVQSFTTLTSLPPPRPVLPSRAITMPGGVPAFDFAMVTGYNYRLAYKNGLTDAAWLPVIAPLAFPPPDGWSATSTGSPMSLSDTNSVGQPQRFYRLEADVP